MRSILLAASLAFSVPLWGITLETNGNFASPEGWLLHPLHATISSNTLILKRIDDNKTESWALQRIKLEKGRQYDLKFDFKADNIASGAEVRIEFPPNWKAAVIHDIEAHSLAWTPFRFRFTAAESALQLTLRIKAGPSDSRAEFRRLAIMPAGELLPPEWSRISSVSPWGWNKTPIRCEVVTNDLVPEKSMELNFSIRSEGKGCVRWYLEPLDINGRTSGPKQQGTAGESPVKYGFHVPPDTAQLRIVWESEKPFELMNASLLRAEK